MPNSNLDVRHRFVFNALAELPFGRGRMFGHDWNSATNAILGGWQISPIFTFASGFPFDVICQYCYSPSTRPDLVGPLQQLNHVKEWFNTASFVRAATNGSGTPIAPGTGPRNPFTGPGTKTVDLSIGKNFRITERFATEFRGEFFNLLNTPQFSQPDGNMNDGNKFGQVTSLRLDSQREIQLSLRVSF